jgi:hypothetical protein
VEVEVEVVIGFFSEETNFDNLVELKPLKGLTIDNKIDINFGMTFSEVKNILGLQKYFTDDELEFDDPVYDIKLYFDEKNKLTSIYFTPYFPYTISIYGYIIESLDSVSIQELGSLLKEKSEIVDCPSIASRYDYNYYFPDIGIELDTYLQGYDEDDEDESDFIKMNEGFIITGLGINV